MRGPEFIIVFVRRWYRLELTCVICDVRVVNMPVVLVQVEFVATVVCSCVSSVRVPSMKCARATSMRCAATVSTLQLMTICSVQLYV